jgi:hypothetical protein
MLVLYEIYQVLHVQDVQAHALEKLVQKALAILARFYLNLKCSIPEEVSFSAVSNGGDCNNMPSDSGHPR